MNNRILRRTLSKVHKDWIESITDSKVKTLVKTNTIITGGSIVSLLLGERVKDYDLYFTDKKTVLAVANYYVKEFNKLHKKEDCMHQVPKVVEDKDRIRIRVQSAGIVSESNEAIYQFFESTSDDSAEEYTTETMKDAVAEADEIDGSLLDTYKNKEGEPYRPVFITDNAITLAARIQLIIRFYGTPDEIHSNFDYVHCTNYWTSKDNKLVLKQEALESIITKDLRYIGSKYPICSIVRLRRLVRKGWFANAGQILKMCMQLSELKLTDISVLEEQLIGVDTAYFIEMIKILKEESAEGKDIDSAYITTIIDRLF